MITGRPLKGDHGYRGLAAEARPRRAFRDNAITEKVLPNLTAEDLKDLGVSMVGHRRMLLDAIATLRADADVKVPPPPPETPSAFPKPTQDAAERAALK